MSENEAQISVPKKLSKADQKRQQIFLDRVKRHMAAGKSFEEAQEAIQAEDWERMPVEKKLLRIEKVLANISAGFSADIQKMRQNQNILADTMDVNFQAFEKMLAKLGLTSEEQKKLFIEAEAEILSDRQRRREEAEKMKAVASETKKKQELAESVDQPGEAPIPDGAVEYGG